MVVKTCLMVTSGFSLRILAISASTSAMTVMSEVPLAFRMLKVVAGRPSRRASERISPTLSLTFARSESRAKRPPGSMICVSPSACAVRASPSTRIACSPPPTWARPPGESRLSERSCWLTCAAVTPSACMRAGSSSTRISRLTPPPRDTWATPSMPSSRLLMVLSTNQDSSSSESALELTAKKARLAAVGVHALHDGLLDALGQVDAHLGDRVAHVGDRAVDRRADRELDEDARLALDRQRGDVVDVADAGDRALDLLHDLRLDLLRRGARLADEHVHAGEGDVGVERDRQTDERDDSHEEEHDEQHDRRDRVADRPGGHVLHGRPLAGGRRGGGRGGGRHLHLLTLAQEAAGGGDHALLAGEALADDGAGSR